MKRNILIGIELTLFCMIVGTLVSYAAGSNPPSEGVRYTNNGQTTVHGALNDLYSKIGNMTYGNASAGDILSGKTALSGGSQITGTMENKGGTTVTASTVTKSGTTALITVPTAGYYNTSSKLSVPITTLQNTIGGKVVTGTVVPNKLGKGYVSVNVGFRPRYLFIVNPGTSDTSYFAISYNSDVSTEKYYRQSGWKKFSSEDANSAYILKITDTGFTLGTSQSSPTLNYVAVQ